MRERWTIGLGLVFLVLSQVTLFVWIPLDIESGVVEVFRRRRSIGDAMLPMALAMGAGLVSIAMIAGAWRDMKRQKLAPVLSEDTELGPTDERSGTLSRDNFFFLLVLSVTICVSLAAMYTLGPLVLAAAKSFGIETANYRELRATAPWKFIGYGFGGVFLIFALVSFVEQRARWRTLLIAILAVAAMAAVYDVPFDHLLLPPNGDY